jgi:hypothetical protein
VSGGRPKPPETKAATGRAGDSMGGMAGGTAAGRGGDGGEKRSDGDWDEEGKLFFRTTRRERDHTPNATCTPARGP